MLNGEEEVRSKVGEIPELAQLVLYILPQTLISEFLRSFCVEFACCLDSFGCSVSSNSLKTCRSGYQVNLGQIAHGCKEICSAAIQ